MNVAIPTIWFKRGQSYISLAMRQALVKAGHKVFIYARTGGVNGVACMEYSNEFDVPNITTYPTYEIPPKIFSSWLKKNKIDLVLFNEEQYQKGLAAAAKEIGCKVAGYVCREFINPKDLEYYQDYDAVICPTQDCFQVVQKLGLPAQYVKWGVDLNIFKPWTEGKERKDVGVRFFHPAGWGGMYERRGTEFVVEAFKKADLSNAMLLVHMQSTNGVQTKTDGNIRYVSGNLTREALVDYYHYSDVAVLSSKHEGLGLTYLEAQACGLAVLGIDAPPMNEHVIEGLTGYNCKVDRFEDYPTNGQDIFVKAAIVDVDDLAEKMRTVVDSGFNLEWMKDTAYGHAVNELDWAKKGQELVRVLECITKISSGG